MTNTSMTVSQVRAMLDGDGAGFLDAVLLGPAAREAVQALQALVHQLDIGDFVDGIGHPAKMLAAFRDAKRLLASEERP